MNKYLQRILLFSTPLLIQILILIFFIIPKKFAIYGSNDDALIASFSTDKSIGSDADNWIFIKSLLSMPATFFQQIFPSLGVFGLILALTIMISISSIFPLIDFVSHFSTKIFILLILSITFSLFYLFSVIAPTYTGASIYAGSSGFAILFFLLRSNYSKYNDLLLLAGLLITLSYLIRFESFLLTFCFFLALIICDVLFLKDFKKDFYILKLPSLFFLFALFLNFILDQINYNDPNWKEFMELNDRRHLIQLRAAEYELENHLSNLNWTEYDYQMFNKFSLADPNKLNTEQLDIAIESTKSTRGFEPLKSANFIKEMNFIRYSYSGYHWIFICILLSTGALFVGLGRKNLFFLFYVVIIVALSLLINFVFAVSYHLPDRLTFNFIFLALLAIFVISISEFSKKSTNRFSYELLAFVMVALLSYSISQTLPEEFSARTEYQKSLIKELRQQKQTLKQANSSNIYVGTGSRIRYAWQDPYRSYKNPAVNKNLILSGWHNLSPIWSKQVTQIGLDPNKFHQEFFEGQEIYWIDDNGAIERLTNFHQQYSSVPVFLEDQGSLGLEFYRIFKISEVGQTPGD